VRKTCFQSSLSKGVNVGQRYAAALSEREQARRADRMPPEYAIWFARNMCAVDGRGSTYKPFCLSSETVLAIT
jgi:hypothetical protein